MAKNNVDRIPGSLVQEMDWAVSNKGGDGVIHSLFKLSLAAILYHHWRERNFRVIQRTRAKPDEIIQRVIADLRSCMSSWRNTKRSDAHQHFM